MHLVRCLLTGETRRTNFLVARDLIYSSTVRLSPESLHLASGLLSPQIGSGLGYWAKLLRARGVDVNAYDKVAGTPGTASAAPDSSQTKGKSTSKDAKVKSAAEGDGKEDADEGGGGEAPSFWIKVGGDS